MLGCSSRKAAVGKTLEFSVFLLFIQQCPTPSLFAEPKGIVFTGEALHQNGSVKSQGMAHGGEEGCVALILTALLSCGSFCRRTGMSLA